MKIIVLGGGISGLSAAWHLQKQGAEVTVLEKSGRVGGWIETEKGEWLFEKGPRTFRGEHLFELIQDVGLEKELLFSKGGKRYLWHRGKLRSFLPGWILGAIRELFVSKSELEDESIYDFAHRRFGAKIAETVFDPMTLGVYGGEIEKLSVKACFPFLVRWEQERGSVIRGFLAKKKGKSGLFTLRSGMGSLIEALAKKLNVVLNCPVEEVRENGVFAGGKFWEADRIVSALPGQVLGRLTGFWEDFKTKSLWVVRLGFEKEFLKKSGFGYLVPSREKEQLMGMVWDSKIFPEQGEGRLTAMVRDSKKDPIEVTLEALRRHLGVRQQPKAIEALFAKEAIPQFEVGYLSRLQQFLRDMQKHFPKMAIVGNYLEGASVDACIRKAKNIS